MHRSNRLISWHSTCKVDNKSPFFGLDCFNFHPFTWAFSLTKGLNKWFVVNHFTSEHKTQQCKIKFTHHYLFFLPAPPPLSWFGLSRIWLTSSWDWAKIGWRTLLIDSWIFNWFLDIFTSFNWFLDIFRLTCSRPSAAELINWNISQKIWRGPPFWEYNHGFCSPITSPTKEELPYSNQ